MGAVMMANVGVVIVNVILLSALLALYGGMLRDMPTRFTWGLMAFASVLWLQAAVQLTFYATMMQYYAGGVETLVLVQNLLATMASVILLTVTLRPTGAERTTPS